MRIFCRENTSLNLACRGHKAVLVTADSSDRSQHWIKDSSAVGNLTDNQGARAFALVNVTTGQALVNPNSDEFLKLAPYSGHVSVELQLLWSLGEELDDGFREIRALQENVSFVSPYHLTFNVFGGSPIKEGAAVGTYPSSPGYGHAIWKIAPINQ